MGENMKKIIYLTIPLILLPSLTILILKPKNNEHIYKIEKKQVRNETVRVLRNKTNEIETIELEEYLIGVLAGEMPVSYEIEALKAQAVAARTYTLRKKEINKDNNYDVVDTTNDQVYLDEEYLKQSWGESYDNYIKKIKQAVKETSGEYLTYEGKIIQAFFFSTSSGTTENCIDVFGENLPYLQSVSSTWDENSPSYIDKKTFTKQELYEKLEIPYDEKINIEIERNSTNSIKTITINNKKILGTEFRKKLNLKSTNLEIKEEDNNIIITSKGFGHGVGMSQYGAEQMALQGYKYDEILKYYYQGTEFKKI